MATWRNGLTTNSKRLSHIYETAAMSDITFQVGRDPETMKTFKLHKFVLAMCSDVFYAMFYGSLPEEDSVRVIDIEPAIFGIVMGYVYNDFLSLKSMEEATETYLAADKYNIVPLLNSCVSYITSNIRPENIPILYRTPIILEALELKNKCEKVLSEETGAILKSDKFLEAPLKLVKDIVQLNNLNINSEVELFQFVMKWAKFSVSVEDASDRPKALRTEMDHFLPHIRFLAMSREEFISGPMISGILTDSEIVSILENMVAPGRRDLPSWCDPRKC